MLINADNLIPVSAFSRGRASEAFKKAHVSPVYVLKNNTVDSVILNYETYKAQQERLEDLEDYVLAIHRLESDDSQLTTEQVFGAEYTPIDDGYEPEFE